MSRPNILLLFSDEHSFRCMGHRMNADGGEPVATPALDQLASQSTVFTNAYCQMPLCTPSRLSMLTGREARRAGSWGNESVLAPDLATLPGVLRDSGYETCLVGKMHLGGTQQFVGYQHRPYGDLTGYCGHQWEPLPKPAEGMRDRTRTAVGVTGIPESMIQDVVVCQESAAFLREHTHAKPDTPWFLTASFSRPHFPLTAPKRHIDRYWPTGVTEPKVGRTGDSVDHPMTQGMRAGFKSDEIDHDEMMYARACYFACVSYLDEVLGDFLSQLDRNGLLENTIIVYTTDHGELAGEHGLWWKNSWHEGSSHIPMMISTPQQRAGDALADSVETPVGLYDLMPTLLSMAGVEAPAGLDGESLAGVVAGEQVAPDRPVVTDALAGRWGEGTEFRSVRQGKYKVMRFRSCEPLAFDMEADPLEQHNLFTDEDVPEAVRLMMAFAEESIDFDAVAQERQSDQELRQQYAHGLRGGTANLFLLPDGRLVSADDALYNPTVLAETPAAAFGENYDQQNQA